MQNPGPTTALVHEFSHILCNLRAPLVLCTLSLDFHNIHHFPDISLFRNLCETMLRPQMLSELCDDEQILAKV